MSAPQAGPPTPARVPRGPRPCPREQTHTGKSAQMRPRAEATTSLPFLVTPSLKAVHRSTARGACHSLAPGPGPPAHATLRRPGDLSARAPRQLSFTGGATTAHSPSWSDSAGHSPPPAVLRWVAPSPRSRGRPLLRGSSPWRLGVCSSRPGPTIEGRMPQPRADARHPRPRSRGDPLQVGARPLPDPGSGPDGSHQVSHPRGAPSEGAPQQGLRPSPQASAAISPAKSASLQAALKVPPRRHPQRWEESRSLHLRGRSRAWDSARKGS
ncbi:hypothetical protein NDU88_005136 [Pleurodeles waltl]|uniref:Uncharacterized protein n=1 Tax=Pleurodeles waltl TaxID=8319 RepID=A0AAV7M931_PLEWA|nr:hypothetical protein NDU88_005136 [Pleurodeles waltl]